MPTQKILAAYYANQFSYSDGLINEGIIRTRGKIIVSKLHQLDPLAKTLCDIGSGYGFFLDEAQKKGAKVFGIEPSQQLVHYAFRKYAIKSFLGTLEEYMKENREQFDVVTCIHVIEHVTEPKNFVFDLLRLVKPGGILFIETPNSDSHLLYAERENYTFLIPPHHLWIFSKESIKELLPENSRIIFSNTYSYSEHLMGIIKQRLSSRAKSRDLASEMSEKFAEFTLSNAEGLDFRALPAGRSAMPRNDNIGIKKRLSYFLLDRLFAPLFTGFLNLYHKGSILELYIKKN